MMTLEGSHFFVVRRAKSLDDLRWVIQLGHRYIYGWGRKKGLPYVREKLSVISRQSFILISSLAN